MRLVRLSTKAPQSLQIQAEVESLIRERELKIGIDPDAHFETRILDLDANVKSISWAIGLEVSQLSAEHRHVRRRLFIKQPSEDGFQGELSAIKLKDALNVSQFPNVSSPFFFSEKNRLVISELEDGENLKSRLRKSNYWPPSKNRNMELVESFHRVGNWLASFHEHSMHYRQAPDSSMDSPGLADLLHISEVPIVPKVDPQDFLDTLRVSLSKMTSCLKGGYVHGDFGPQNVLCSKTSLAVVDWEFLKQGLGIEDCVQFVVITLTQARYSLFDFGRTELFIRSFLNGYQSQIGSTENFAEIVTLLAISNVYKRQEWSNKPFSMVEHILFLPLLRRLAVKNYEKLSDS